MALPAPFKGGFAIQRRNKQRSGFWENENQVETDKILGEYVWAARNEQSREEAGPK